MIDYFQQGRDDYYRGALLENNPYVILSKEGQQWQDGWWYAYMIDNELY